MRNPLHSICPYFAMFPESFVQKQLLAYSRPGERLFDPFCGRGTTILEGLLNKREVVGSDINPVAACVSGAKADIPNLREVLDRIDTLELAFKDQPVRDAPPHEFFRACYSERTLQHVLHLQSNLAWKTDRVDRMIAAMTLGVLHGESHRTELCLSNRMPRTISTKPDYSVRWWRERELEAPDRDAFDVLKRTALFRFAGDVPQARGDVVLGDARNAGEMLKAHEATVALVITSPPYLDTTDYAEDQWLRLWFLGGPDRPSARLHRDDRHTSTELYWEFLSEVWAGGACLLRQDAHIVVRIGGTMLGKTDLFAGLYASLRQGLGGRTIRPLHEGETSSIRKRQTNSFRPGTSPEKSEHDFAFAISA
jgi:hypothetical protein